MNKLLPLLLTFLRVLLVPLILFFLFFSKYEELVRTAIVCLLFVTGSLSDFFDGYFARKFKAATRLGAFADPLADKVFTLSIFVSFLFLPSLKIPGWVFIFVLLIFIRETFITILRIYTAVKNIKMKTARHGKIKTTVQLTSQSVIMAILLLYALQDSYPELALPFLLKNILNFLPALLIILSSLVTLYSGISYLQTNRFLIKMNR
ncbi:MAG TPA: CDP-diacylglycerol--glycerol-3-phosphate 3-phosphatidyltransferase [Spirochaetota bacterium]|nr:CDP-diacylglycerol--glycerol-3-phosphate 3-phosphatidyltransferase [Spirochaetota bacterium]